MSFHQFIKDNVPSNSILDFYELDNRDRLTEFAQQPTSRYAAIVGHLPYSFFVGLNLPAQASHTTILREPIERLISYYHYIRSSKTHYLHEWVMTENVPMHQFFESKPTMEIDNLHVRFLCTTDCSNVPIGGCTKEMLEEAKQNIVEKFDVFGLQEYFDESVAATALVNHWKHKTSPEINRAEKKNKTTDIPKETSDLITETNQLDIQLYEYARPIFIERLKRAGLM